MTEEEKKKSPPVSEWPLAFTMVGLTFLLVVCALGGFWILRTT